MRFVRLRIDSKSPELSDYASEMLDEIVPEAVVRKYRTAGGFILVTIWNDAVHEVIYQTPLRFFWSRMKRKRELLRFYGDGQSWAEDWPIDFGTSQKRSDGEVRAIYSKIMDYMTFVTTEFSRYRSDLRWKDVTN